MSSKLDPGNSKLASAAHSSEFRFSSFVFRPFLGTLLAGMMLASAWVSAQSPGGQDYQTKRARYLRGRYLAENVLLCFTCHSEVNWKAPGAPLRVGMKGAGAMFPDEGVPFPLLAPNITPDPETGAGKWTDEQLARAIREGIGHDGRVLFPAMPYPFFHQLSDEDVASVIVYLRSLRPLRREHPKTPVPPPVQKTLHPMPITAPVASPDLSDPVKRGAYLVKSGLCGDCHTPLDEKGQPMLRLVLAGGRVLKGPWGEVASSNLTPDASGIAYYNEKLFLQAMREGRVGARKLNSIMLWGYFRNMTEQDLKAIFAYLRTLPGTAHRVDNTEPPTYCRLCRQRHGYGDRN